MSVFLRNPSFSRDTNYFSILGILFSREPPATEGNHPLDVCLGSKGQEENPHFGGSLNKRPICGVNLFDQPGFTSCISRIPGTALLT